MPAISDLDIAELLGMVIVAQGGGQSRVTVDASVLEELLLIASQTAVLERLTEEIAL